VASSPPLWSSIPASVPPTNGTSPVKFLRWVCGTLSTSASSSGSFTPPPLLLEDSSDFHQTRRDLPFPLFTPVVFFHPPPLLPNSFSQHTHLHTQSTSPFHIWPSHILSSFTTRSQTPVQKTKTCYGIPPALPRLQAFPPSSLFFNPPTSHNFSVIFILYSVFKLSVLWRSTLAFTLTVLVS
jgi:hypothetical protein